jgi:hypothetical protein
MTTKIAIFLEQHNKNFEPGNDKNWQNINCNWQIGINKENWAKIVALLVEKFEILFEHNNVFLMCHEVVSRWNAKILISYSNESHIQ